MAADATSYLDNIAITARELDVPDADWGSGGIMGASCSPGIGISDKNPGLQQQLPNWTLLDQNGDARNPQVGSIIGNGNGAGSTGMGQSAIVFVENPVDGNGGFESVAPAHLQTLEAGWVPVI